MVFCNMISLVIHILIIKSHNPYFNRWFSAIRMDVVDYIDHRGHNPYFNRWFSAMLLVVVKYMLHGVTILILIDGFLQYIIK